MSHHESLSWFPYITYFSSQFGPQYSIPRYFDFLSDISVLSLALDSSRFYWIFFLKNVHIWRWFRRFLWRGSRFLAILIPFVHFFLRFLCEPEYGLRDAVSCFNLGIFFSSSSGGFFEEDFFFLSILLGKFVQRGFWFCCMQWDSKEKVFFFFFFPSQFWAMFEDGDREFVTNSSCGVLHSRARVPQILAAIFSFFPIYDVQI